ncbi:MAG: major capsid protein [Arizlama microvirus]|nr:MAG: major capsid protein [Arizlama microvirus]
MSYNGPQRGLVKNSGASMVPRNDIPRSRYITKQIHNTSFDAGFLVPFVVDEVLPGDHFNYEASAFVRLATPLFPIFSSMKVDTFFFFVPNRLVWDKWTYLMGEREPDELYDTSTLVPTVLSEIGANGFAAGNLADHFGLPTVGQLTAGAIAVNAMPFRAYNLIWNEWFRDQNIQDKVDTYKGDDPKGEVLYQMMRRNKYHDYFTSALPWPQKGPEVQVPLQGQLPVSGIGFGAGGVTGPTGALRETGIGPSGTTSYVWYSIETQQPTYFRFTGSTSGYPSILAELAGNGFLGVEDIRAAMQLQSYYEKDARGGTRYVEKIFSQFGVRNPDYRLQRPEYIGGGSSPIMITPVAQTAVSGGTTVGALGAAGTAIGVHRASYAATEHGYILGLINVQSDLLYQQGVHKMWSRFTAVDFYFPTFASLGEQAITRKEIYCKNDGNDGTVFGYQERYEEYRQFQSLVTGKFKSSAVGTLDAWHLGQNFVTPPTLSTSFLIDNPPMSRILAASTAAEGQQFLANIMIDRNVTRPIPTHGVPASLGRF